MDVMLFIASLIFAFFINTVISELVRIKKKKRADAIEYFNSIIHPVSIETHHDIEYWFDDSTKKFLAQGKNLDEILEVLKSRFPGHVFLFDQGGFSENTDWKFVRFDGHNTGTFVTQLLYGKAQ